MELKAFYSLEQVNRYLESIEFASPVPEGIEDPIDTTNFDDCPQPKHLWTVEPNRLDKIDEFEKLVVYTLDDKQMTGEGGCFVINRIYLLIDAR